jgi:O-antigen ligase
MFGAHSKIKKGTSRALEQLRASAKFSPLEWGFILPTLAISLGFSFGGLRFGKWGIPIDIPGGLGQIENFVPKIFPMELYLIFLFGLTAICRLKPSNKTNLTPIFLLSVAAIAWTALRMAPDFGDNPALAIRNSAFIWYLLVPILISLLPMRLEAIRAVILLHLAILGTVFFLSYLAKSFGLGWGGPVPTDIGLLYFLCFLLMTRRKRLAALGLILVGVYLGVSFLERFQRTILLGLLLTPPILILLRHLHLLESPLRIKRLAVVLPGFLLGFVLHLYPTHGLNILEMLRSASNTNPLKKVSTNESALEEFRIHMWREAAGKFASSPFLGVGFQAPVVESVYIGSGDYSPNVGAFERPDSPPIAGPHNSYLNALARLGLPGLLVLALHLYVAQILIANKLILEFFLLLGQMLYATFNVGLEGPVRSFQILLLIALAIKCQEMRRTLPTHPTENQPPLA